MSESISRGQESIAVDLPADAPAYVGELVEVIEDQQKVMSDQHDMIEDLRDDLAEHREETARERAEDRQRISDLEDRVEDLESGHDPKESTGEEATADDLTPVERLSRSDDVDDMTDSASVRRAVALFKNLPDWGTRTPKGIVLKPADNPLQLLQADRDESLAWKQYYRAAEALERLSCGAVTFFDSDRHGKMLVLHEQSEAHDRVRNGALSTSTVAGGS